MPSCAPASRQGLPVTGAGMGASICGGGGGGASLGCAPRKRRPPTCAQRQPALIVSCPGRVGQRAFQAGVSRLEHQQPTVDERGRQAEGGQGACPGRHDVCAGGCVIAPAASPIHTCCAPDCQAGPLLWCLREQGRPGLPSPRRRIEAMQHPTKLPDGGPPLQPADQLVQHEQQLHAISVAGIVARARAAPSAPSKYATHACRHHMSVIAQVQRDDSGPMARLSASCWAGTRAKVLLRPPRRTRGPKSLPRHTLVDVSGRNNAYCCWPA